MPPPTFSQRLVARQRLWWQRDRVHRWRERRARRSREDPDERWRCCELWQRTLINKWNGREFAARHGCALPELYWSGSDRSAAPLDTLPDRFVIRPLFGAHKEGVAVVVDGREMLVGGSATPAQLRQGPGPILIEEFVEPAERDANQLPLEYKVHTFAEEVATVELLVRAPATPLPKHRYYTPAWEPIADRINTYSDHDEEVREPPPDLERILELTRRIGAELGTYMRIDFFGAERGCVFNEFSSVPLLGRHYTPHCDKVLGALWAERIPDAT